MIIYYIPIVVVFWQWRKWWLVNWVQISLDKIENKRIQKRKTVIGKESYIAITKMYRWIEMAPWTNKVVCFTDTSGPNVNTRWYYSFSVMYCPAQKFSSIGYGYGLTASETVSRSAYISMSMLLKHKHTSPRTHGHIISLNGSGSTYQRIHSVRD